MNKINQEYYQQRLNKVNREYYQQLQQGMNKVNQEYYQQFQSYITFPFVQGLCANVLTTQSVVLAHEQRREALRRHFGMATEDTNTTVVVETNPSDMVHDHIDKVTDHLIHGRTVEKNPSDMVQDHIDKVTDHLIHGRTTQGQRKSLGKAVEQADRVSPATNEAFGRILGGKT